MRYEVYRADGQRWQVAGLYDDKELALADARSIMARNHADGVKVVENAGEGNQVIFLKRKDSSESLREVRQRKERAREEEAARAERQARREKHLAGEAARARRERLRRVIAASLFLGGVFTISLYVFLT
jgi:hypothetical protein